MGRRVLDCIFMSLKEIESNIPKISEQGFNIVQTPVLQPNKFIDLSHSEVPWWGQFQVTSISEIGNQYGSLDDLKSLIKTANKYGIDISLNVVFTHVAGLNNGYIYPHELVDRRLVNNMYFWKSFNPINNWNDRFEVITKSHGLPCLNLENYDLQDIVIEFLHKLVGIGVKGIRIDSGKSIALPSEGSDFFTRVLGQFKGVLYDYTEVIFEDEWLIDEYSKYTNVLTNSVGSDRAKMITYVCSHDSDLEFKISNKVNSFILASEYLDLCSQYENTLWYIRKNPDNTFDDFWKTHVIKIANKKEVIQYEYK